MKTVIVTAPTSEPVTLDEAKEQLRIESAFTLDDDYINALISVARSRCESYCNQFFTEQDISILSSGQMQAKISLPYPNLTVTAINYTDADNVSQVLAPSAYVVDSLNQVITITDPEQSIDYQVEATTDAPAEIVGVQHAIKMIVTDLYELRTETAAGVSLADNPAVKALLYPYRLSLGV